MDNARQELGLLVIVNSGMRFAIEMYDSALRTCTGKTLRGWNHVAFETGYRLQQRALPLPRLARNADVECGLTETRQKVLGFPLKIRYRRLDAVQAGDH